MKRLLFLLILLAGIALRWYGLDWSLPQYFHPDEIRLYYAIGEISWQTCFKVTEQSMENLQAELLPQRTLEGIRRLENQEFCGEQAFVAALDQQIGTDATLAYKGLILKQSVWKNMNPHFFAYGSLPIYLMKFVYSAAESLMQSLSRPSINFLLIGRIISAIFGSLTLIVLYLFGRRFFSTRVALLSMAFLAFTVFHIQLSHFLTVDVMLTFFILLALYLLAALVDFQQADLSSAALLKNYLLAGVVIGLAMATKASALPIYGVFLAAHLLVIYLDSSRFVTRYSAALLWGMFAAALILSGVVFLICEPYALLDYANFSRQINEQSNMVRGLTQPPYVIQYEQTRPYIYPIQQLAQYAMGLPLGLLTLLGTGIVAIALIVTAMHRKTLRGLPPQWYTLMILFAWTIPVAWIVGGFEVKFLRYTLPLIPCFCLFGAVCVERVLFCYPSRMFRGFIWGITAGVLGWSIFYSAAFVGIYHREDPRIAASRWIYKHVAAGKTLLTEAWEFVGFVGVDERHPGEYRTLDMKLYDLPDSEEKIRRFAQQLEQADVIMLATKRLYGSILRVPERYPLTSRYYRQLFDGALGFSVAAVFTNYPSLFGVTFNDDFADESFSVYDHPKTILLQKTETLSADEIFEQIMSASPIEDDALLKRLIGFPAFESDAAQTPIQSDIERAPTKIGTMAQSEWQAVLIWLAAVELLAFIAFSYLASIFRNFPEFGYALSKVIGILVPSYCIWILVSLKISSYSRSLIALIIALLGGVAIALFLANRAMFRQQFKRHWKTYAMQESVFVLAFAGFALFRAYNPDIFWSESSMDFSFLNVLCRADVLPPPDPWISGFPLNYYYFGHFLVATLTKFTGILPSIAYNLAFALFPALVILEVFSLMFVITKRVVYGFVGVVFAAIIGNLDGCFLLFDTWLGKESIYRFFRPAHEVIRYTVHEFPFWTFIFVDLHAHLLNMPFLLATFICGFCILADEQFLGQPLFRLQTIGAIAFIALIIGTLGVISSWDYPTGVIFLLFAAAIRSYLNRRWQTWMAALRPLIYLIFAAIPASFLLYSPFYRTFSRSGMGIGFVGDATTQFSAFLTIFGFFFFLIFSWLILMTKPSQPSSSRWMDGIALFAVLFMIYILANRLLSINYATLLFALFLSMFGSYLAVISLKKFLLMWMKFPIEQMYIWLCLIYACLIVAGCEIVFVRDFLQGGDYKRMNTIFKFYIPVWFLLAFAATYSVSQLWTVFSSRKFEENSLLNVEARSFWAVCLKALWRGCFGILIVCSLVFPIMGISARRHQQDVYRRTYFPPTLNGLAYIQAERPDEYKAIRWLNEHVYGMPVIVEAVGADYLYEYARISANTGLPTIMGWKSHAEQREHWGQADSRAGDVQTIYTNLDIRAVLELLRRYRVKYLYIGETERRDFQEERLERFADYPQYFQSVFQSGDTVIYRVLL